MHQAVRGSALAQGQIESFEGEHGAGSGVGCRSRRSLCSNKPRAPLYLARLREPNKQPMGPPHIATNTTSLSAMEHRILDVLRLM